MEGEHSEEPSWYVYCLKSSGGWTYIGATVNLDRRLQQHRGILSGGARATAARLGRGETWNRHCYVGPFEKIAALKFEWRWKYMTRKLSGGTPLQRRERALTVLLEEKSSEGIDLNVEFS